MEINNKRQFLLNKHHCLWKFLKKNFNLICFLNLTRINKFQISLNTICSAIVKKWQWINYFVEKKKTNKKNIKRKTNNNLTDKKYKNCYKNTKQKKRMENNQKTNTIYILKVRASCRMFSSSYFFTTRLCQAITYLV